MNMKMKKYKSTLLQKLLYQLSFIEEEEHHYWEYEVVGSHFLFAKTAIFIICNDT